MLVRLCAHTKKSLVYSDFDKVKMGITESSEELPIEKLKKLKERCGDFLTEEFSMSSEFIFFLLKLQTLKMRSFNKFVNFYITPQIRNTDFFFLQIGADAPLFFVDFNICTCILWEARQICGMAIRFSVFS